MGRIQRLVVHNYRSISGPLDIKIPPKVPLALVGENNTGKSNLVRAIDLVLGDSWPGNYAPEDHEFYNRERGTRPIQISVAVNGVVDPRYNGALVEKLVWSFDQEEKARLRTYFENGDDRATNNEVRQQCMCVVIEADRRLSYQLSYASQYTYLSKLMKSFHDRLVEDPDRVQRLEAIFDSLKATFQEVSEFSTFSEELVAQVSELCGGLNYGLEIDFSAYNPSNIFRALRVQARENSEVREFEELGTGQQQLLALSFAYAYAKAFHEASNLILVIEEPEANLHPLAQKWVALKIHELAQEGIQVILTTHSSAFLNIEDIEGLVVISKDSDGTKAVQLNRFELAQHCRQTGAAKAEAETILPFYSAAATEELLSGFFARRILLVEGPSEALALPEYFEQTGVHPTRDGLAIIPVHGVGNLAKWWRLFTAYEIPTYVLFDNDGSQDDPQGIKRQDLLQALEVPAREQASNPSSHGLAHYRQVRSLWQGLRNKHAANSRPRLRSVRRRRAYRVRPVLQYCKAPPCAFCRA